jgi:hypothetical protein
MNDFSNRSLMSTKNKLFSEPPNLPTLVNKAILLLDLRDHAI